MVSDIMSARNPSSEAEILDRVIRPTDGGIAPEAARALLQLGFDAGAKKTIVRLLQANGSGKISAEERLLLERYVRVGQLIDLVQAKARLSLAAAKA